MVLEDDNDRAGLDQLLRASPGRLVYECVRGRGERERAAASDGGGGGETPRRGPAEREAACQQKQPPPPPSAGWKGSREKERRRGGARRGSWKRRKARKGRRSRLRGNVRAANEGGGAFLSSLRSRRFGSSKLSPPLPSRPSVPCGRAEMAMLDLALEGLAVFGLILFVVLWLMHFMSIIYT